MEKWKRVTWISGRTKYQVSSLGRIRSVDRKSVLDANKIIPGCFISQHHRNKEPDNYLTVCLGAKTYTAHRVVAMAFIPNPENKPEINHKNGIKWDNRVENLEWCTRLENVTHARFGGRWHMKIKDSDVLFIRQKFKELGKHELAKMFNVDPSYIYQVATHKEKAFVETEVYQLNSPMPSKEVLQFDKAGNFIAEHHSISAAARSINGLLSQVQRVISGARTSYKGYSFRLKGAIELPKPSVAVKVRAKRQCRKVVQMTKEGEQVNIFPSKVAAAKGMGMSLYTIRDTLTGKQKTANGFILKYA